MTVSEKMLVLFFLLCALSACSIGVAGTPSIGVSLPSGAFNPDVNALVVNYSLGDPNAGDVKLQVTDDQGYTVRTIDAGTQEAGSYALSWAGLRDNGQPVPDGVYTLKVLAGEGMIPASQDVLRWDSGAPASHPGLSYYPYSPATDAKGNIYLTDSRQDCVLKFDRYGNLLRKWGSTGSDAAQFRDPAGIATDAAGNVYVVDALNSRVEKFDADGRFLRQWGGYGTEDGKFDCPSGIALDDAGNVYVADTWNHRIQYFDGDGGFIGGWGSYGSGAGQLDAPCGIAVGPDGTVYVADTYNDRIQRFSPSGELLGAWGSIGDRPLAAPSGVSVTDAGNLLVVDAGNHRAQEVTAAGTPLRVDYAPDAYIDTSADVPTFPAGNGYVARWSPAADGSDDLAFLSEHGCLLVRDLVPFTLGEPVAVVAEARAVVDRSPPMISITTPDDGARYTLDQKVSALWKASDDLSGLSAAAGTVASGSPLDTSLPGPHVFTVEATDNAGNHRTLSCQYYVYDNIPAGGSITGPTQSPGPTPRPGTTPTPKPPTPTPPPAGPTGAVVMLNGGTRISCELATTVDQINRGLMYRPSLASGTGMLFVFTSDQDHTFTMANMNFPLDIVFIRSDMTIINIARNAQPGTTGISSGGSCQYVLEVNAGVASGVGPGNTVQITWV